MKSCLILRLLQFKIWVNDFILFFLFFIRTLLSLRVSRCAPWLSLLEGSRVNWNIPCNTCQRGWKLSVIYNNRPSRWCFYPCHLWLKLSFLITELRSAACTRVWTVFICCFSLCSSWPPKWTLFFFLSRELQHLELTVCLLWRFKRGPGVTFAHGSSVQCSLGQTRGPKCGSFCCQQGHTAYIDLFQTGGNWHVLISTSVLMEKDK